MSKMIRLNESDLRHMVRRVVNEILSMEGDEAGHDKYYFRCGWSNDSSNRFDVEGAVGENYEGFVKALQEYVVKKTDEYEKKKGQWQLSFDHWLERAKERHGRYTRKTQKSHEMQIRRVNQARGTNYPEYLNPGGSDYYLYDRYLQDIANEDEDLKKWLQRDLIVSVDMPVGDHDSAWGTPGWRRYAQMGPKSKAFPIDPENVEASAKMAWDLFNEYAAQTPEVVGWFLWSWSTFQPTIRPILSPEVGQEISDEGDKISRFYDSLGYKGD